VGEVKSSIFAVCQVIYGASRVLVSAQLSTSSTRWRGCAFLKYTTYMGHNHLLYSRRKYTPHFSVPIEARLGATLTEENNSRRGPETVFGGQPPSSGSFVMFAQHPLHLPQLLAPLPRPPSLPPLPPRPSLVALPSSPLPPPPPSPPPVRFPPV